MPSDQNYELLANARITLTIEVEADGTWGAKCDLDQVNRQAGDATLRAVQDLFSKPEVRKHVRARVVGEPTVDIVTFRRKK